MAGSTHTFNVDIMKNKDANILAGIEIGTSAVKVVIGEAPADDGPITVHGFAECPSDKVVKGEIEDANVVFEHVSKALELAERNAGVGVRRNVYFSITGAHVKSVNSRGITYIRTADRRITAEHCVDACRNARYTELPPEKRELNTFDRRFIIDGQRESANPVNMVGGKLEAERHLIYGHGNSIDTACNLIADILSYPAADMAFAGLASSYGVVDSDAMERGVLVIDIGAGVTEYVLLHGPGVFLSGQITVGCNQICNDLSIGLRLNFKRCQSLLVKDFIEHGGRAVMTPDGRTRMLPVTTMAKAGIRHIPMSGIEQIIELRLRELFEVIMSRVNEDDARSRIGYGVVLTGGGACIPDIERLARQVCNLPVTIGIPRVAEMAGEEILSPRFATPVGLLKFGRLSLDISSHHGQVTLLDEMKSDWSKLFGYIGRAFKW